MIAYVVLIGSLFYYVAKGVRPELVSGKVLFAFLAMLSMLLLGVRSYVQNRLVPRRLHLAMLLLVVILVLLYFIIGHIGDYRRYETSLTLYFGICVFMTFFYFLFSFEPFNPGVVIKWFIIVISLAALLEFVLINNGQIDLLPHWKIANTTDAYLISKGKIEAQAHKVLGLLANRSDSACFMVALFWLYIAFNQRITWVMALLALGFTACLSATGFAVLLVTGLVYTKRVASLVVIGVMVALVAIGSVFEYASKLSSEYLLYVINYKLSFLETFVERFQEYPSLLFIGAPDQYQWGIYDIYVLKALTDFGMLSLIISGSIVAMTVVNFNSYGMNKKSFKALIMAMASLMLGTFHYPVLFSIPTQALLGALAAYSIHVRYGTAAEKSLMSGAGSSDSDEFVWAKT